MQSAQSCFGSVCTKPFPSRQKERHVKQTSRNFAFLTPLVIVGMTFACNDDNRSHNAPVRSQRSSSQTTTRVQSQQDTSAVSAEDFGLPTVIGLVESNAVKNGEELEQRINDPSSGINNVDVDGDGQTDYIGVTEEQSATGKTFSFVAFKSSDQDAEPIPIATVTLTQDTTTDTVSVSGGYPEYVHGYRDHYYHRPGLSLGDYMLLRWAFGPRPMYSYGPMWRSSWAPRPVMSRSVARQTRTSYRTTTKMRPVAQSKPRPASYKGSAKSQNYAKRVKSGAVKMPKKTGTVSGNTNQMRDFKGRDKNKPAPKGSSFGSTPKKPALKPPTRPTNRPAYTPKPSTPSRRPSYTPPKPRPKPRARPRSRSRGRRR